MVVSIKVYIYFLNDYYILKNSNFLSRPIKYPINITLFILFYI